MLSQIYQIWFLLWAEYEWLVEFVIEFYMERQELTIHCVDLIQ